MQSSSEVSFDRGDVSPVRGSSYWHDRPCDSDRSTGPVTLPTVVRLHLRILIFQTSLPDLETYHCYHQDPLV